MAEYFDVLIVGAGISGIGAAYNLQNQCPEKSFVILENLESFGGTWLMHRYPGTRSDSDLYTFGYKFKPWTGTPIASREEILKYMGEVIDENAIDDHIRYHHHIKTAIWSSDEKQWTLTATRKDTSEELEFTCNFLWMCQGYYRHSEGYTPDWPGLEKYKGQIVHPQTWPDDFDYKDKNVLVIGSGATAATLIPAMAEDCKHITMLQRSPTYFIPAENRNELADTLREIDTPEEWTHAIVRKKILHDQQTFTRRSFEDSEAVKNELIGAARAYLGDDYDIETHFTPKYRPWRQRVAFVPEGDLFKGIKAGLASVVTDEIDTFTERGILLKSGDELEADIIITATGFNLCMLGDIEFTIDGEPLEFADKIGWRGILYTGIPNMAWVFGYFRTSWTMRADLISDFVCRLLNHMDEKGVTVCTPELRANESNMPALPFIDEENFNAGYLLRNIALMPKQGDHQPWIFSQDYYREKDEIPAADLEDGTLKYN